VRWRGAAPPPGGGGPRPPPRGAPGGGPPRGPGGRGGAARARPGGAAAAAAGAAGAPAGQVEVSPGNVNAIPGRCVVSLDLRDIDRAVRDRVEADIDGELDAIAVRRGLEVASETLQREEPVEVDAAIAAALDAAVGEVVAGEVVHLPSGAAHDAMVLAEVAPVGMLFVRSRDGLSHTPDEFTSTADLDVAARALVGALRRLTGPASGS
jgi:allantoate deiminase